MSLEDLKMGDLLGPDRRRLRMLAVIWRLRKGSVVGMKEDVELLDER